MKRVKILLLVSSIFLLLFIQTFTAEAGAHLSWKTTSISYDSNGALHIYGYFLNDGDFAIDRVNRISFTVTVSEGVISSFTASNIDVYIDPGQSHNWHFWDKEADYAPLAGWNVKSSVNYHYIR